MGLLKTLERLIRHPRVLAAMLVAAVLVAAPGLLRLNPRHDVIGAFAQSLGQPVPAAASQLVVAVQLSSPGRVSELAGVATDLADVHGVDRVTMPADPSVWTQEAPESLHNDIIKTVLGSVDPLWAPLHVTLDPALAQEVVPQLRQQLSARSGLSWAMAGPPVTRFAQAEVVQREQVWLLALTTSVLSVCLWVLSRRVWGALLPMLSVGAACVLLAGVIGWSGRGLGGPNVLLLPLVVVLGLSDSMYLLRAVVRLRSRIEDPFAVVIRAMRDTAPACALTTATTAIGFGVLALSSSPSLREFGMFAALGVCLALVTGLGVPLIALGLFPSLDVDAQESPRSPLWSALATRVLASKRRGRTIALVVGAAVVLVGLCLTSTTDLRHNGALPTSHWARTEAQTVDRVLGGVIDVVFEVDTSHPGGTAAPNAFDALVRLQRDIASDASVGRVFSFADAALWVGRQAGVTPDALTGSPRAPIARRSRRFSRYYDAAASIAARHDGPPLLTNDAQTYVVYARLRDSGARSWSTLLDTVAERDAAESGLRVRPTGTVLFFLSALQAVSRDALRVLGASMVSSLLVLALVFRRWRLMVGAALVLATTGLAALAVFGVSGIGIQRLHLFAFSAALGVGIDPMVHLRAAYEQAVRSGRRAPVVEALAVCAVPIQRTWLVLTVGLMCLLTSRVPEIREVGVVLLVAFAANLMGTATAFVAVLALEER